MSNCWSEGHRYVGQVLPSSLLSDVPEWIALLECADCGRLLSRRLDTETADLISRYYEWSTGYEATLDGGHIERWIYSSMLIREAS